MKVKHKMSKHYIDNKKFYAEIVAHKARSVAAKEAGKNKPPIPNYIGECFMKIAEHLAYKPNFIHYTYREEMIGDAIENCVMYFESFNPDKTNNPFAYFTMVVWNAFLRRIGKEGKAQYVKYKMLQNHMLFESDAYSDDQSLSDLKPVEIYANIAEYTSSFEKKQKQKKKKKLKKLERSKKGLESFYPNE